MKIRTFSYNIVHIVHFRDVKADEIFKERLDTQIKLKETEFNNKLELELGKKYLDLEKLKNKLENMIYRH